MNIPTGIRGRQASSQIVARVDITETVERLLDVMQQRDWTQQYVESLGGPDQSTLSRWKGLVAAEERVPGSKRNRDKAMKIIAMAAPTGEADQRRAKLLAADELERAAQEAARRLRSEATSAEKSGDGPLAQEVANQTAPVERGTGTHGRGPGDG